MNLWPAIEPYRSGKLHRGEIHELYWEECGNKHGFPIVFFHGGPGSGCTVEDRRFFDPKTYRIILFDQRGSGRSTPLGCVRDNSLSNLVDDVEALRTFLAIEKWCCFGGSWGSTLALAYAGRYPKHCIALILRATFLYRQRDVDRYFNYGEQFYPDAFAEFLSYVGAKNSRVATRLYYERLTHKDEATRTEAAISWNKFDWNLGQIVPPPYQEISGGDLSLLVAKYTIFSHYLDNVAQYNSPVELNGLMRISAMNVWVIHGRYDIVCSVSQSFKLKKHINCGRLRARIIENAGHSIFQPEVLTSVLCAVEELTCLLRGDKLF